MTTKINWTANTDFESVLLTKDFQLRYVKETKFPSLPFFGSPGYQLIYRPTGHVQAEGVDIVAAVGQTFREQRILDKVKIQPELLTQDPAEQQMAAFLSDVEPSGTAN